MSDKTNAAIAAELENIHPAEDPAADPTVAEAPAEDLPAATLEDLEQLDVGAIEPEERPPFRITDDRCADWAVRKIAEERQELDRLTELGQQQIEEINQKIEAAKRRFENGTAFLTSCLADYFNTVPHKSTKTTEKYRLLSGTLVLKRGAPKPEHDDEKLVAWLKANGYENMVKVKEAPEWGELKKMLDFTGTVASIKDTGEIVEGVTVMETPDTFKVDV